MAPNGSFQCYPPEFACPDTRFDSCLSHLTCDPIATSECTSAVQLQLASYLACFEGPFANREVQTNASRRAPCLAQAFGSAAPALTKAINDCLATDVAAVESEINKTRAPMYARLQPNPGSFPHIFLDGKHFWNNSWTGLLRAICELEPSLSACTSSAATLEFNLSFAHPFSCSILTGGDIAKFGSSVRDGANLAASAFAFPEGWVTQDEPGQGNKPSYVDEKAVADAKLTKCTPINNLMLGVRVNLGGILQGLRDTLRGAVRKDYSKPSATGIASMIKDRLVNADYPVTRVTGVQMSPAQ